MRSRTTIALFVSAIAISACGSTTEPATNPTTNPTTVTETNRTDMSPTETNPTETNPTDTSPTDTSPTDTSPTDTSPTDGPTQPADVGDLVGRDWFVTGNVTIGGLQPVPTGANTTMTFTDNGDGTGSLSIDTGCNTGSADVEYSGTQSLTVGPVVLTKMACTDDLNNLEALTLSVLAEPINWFVTDDELSLTPINITDSGLRLSAIAPATAPAGHSADDVALLHDTHWVATAFITNGPLLAVDPASGAGIDFGQDTVEINTGCRVIDTSLTFDAADGSFTVGPFPDDEGCAIDRLDATFVGLLEGPLSWEITNGQLKLLPTNATDAGLILVADVSPDDGNTHDTIVTDD